MRWLCFNFSKTYMCIYGFVPIVYIVLKLNCLIETKNDQIYGSKLIASVQKFVIKHNSRTQQGEVPLMCLLFIVSPFHNVVMSSPLSETLMTLRCRCSSAAFTPWPGHWGSLGITNWWLDKPLPGPSEGLSHSCYRKGFVILGAVVMYREPLWLFHVSILADSGQWIS